MTPAHQLSALAAGLCQDAGIRVEVSERTWAWDAIRRVIYVNAEDLASKGPVYCAAVLAHEVSHYFISRYHLIPVEFPSKQALAHMLNSIEDPRVNTWIKRRYPGTGRWLQRLTETDANSPIKGRMPDFLLFCLECAREELRGWQPAADGTLPLSISDPLQRTRPARIEYAGTLPPNHLMPGPDDADLKERYRCDVWPALIPRAQLDLPTRREQLVRVRVLDALRIAEREILPIAAELLDRDLGRIIQWLKADDTRQHRTERTITNGTGQQLREIVSEAMNSPPAEGQQPEDLRDLAIRTFDAWMRSAGESLGGPGAGQPLTAGSSPGMPTGEDGRSRGGHIPRSRLPGRRGRQRPLRLPPPQTLYDQAYSRIADQVTQLVASIEDLLRPRRRLREISGYPSGHRLDLRRVMGFEADPRNWHQLWMRKSIPRRHNTAIELLVDLSGSMRGPKTDAAVSGTILLAETLHRLQVPFAVTGFQDALIPLCDFYDGLTTPIRDRLGEMPHEVEGCRKGGNNNPSYNDDGPCLKEAAAHLVNCPADDRILIVVSDGLPEGRRSTEKDLREAVASLGGDSTLKLIGVGLGPDTGHVKEFYPNSVANVPVARFAAEIAELLRGILN
jgi:hypothetical protein